MTTLNGWENFYVIVGSAAGALIAIQFVVMTLLAGVPAGMIDAQTGDSYTTPTLVHFGMVLIVSAITSAPWNGMPLGSVLIGLMGLAGITYVLRTGHRIKRHTVYKPVFEDTAFHVFLPLAAYGLLCVSTVLTYSHPVLAPFLAGSATLILLLVGIHNAWDVVRWHVLIRGQEVDKK